MTLTGALAFRAMNPPATRLVRAMLALSCAVAMLLGGGAAQAAEVTYQHESEHEWKSQLTSGQITGVEINLKTQSLHTTLKDGRHVLAYYPKHASRRVEAELTANRVPFKVLTKAKAQAAAKKPVHHKLRYIAGGILLGVIVIVGVVLLFRRRARALD